MAKDLIFEIGTEELPASFIVPASQLLGEVWKSAATAARLGFGAVETHGTPRRLALLVRGVGEKADDLEERAEGPAVSVAFDASGKATKAGEGFARKFGLTVDQLQRTSGPQGERLFAIRKEAGQPAARLLPDLLGKLIVELAKNRKAMRWGDGDAVFPRPVRWICAVLGGELLPVKFADVEAGGVTYGHRFLAPQPLRLSACDEYLPKLREAKVIASIADRRVRVIEEIDRVAQSAGGKRVADDELVDTITGLVEWPSGVLGSFGADALDMPREVLVSEMRGHQKYASIETPEGALMPAFCAIANTPVKDVALSRRGYERVLNSRLADARYFFNQDLTRKLSDRVTDLRRVTFQERLGSVHDKLERMRALAKWLVKNTGGADEPTVERVTFLCKADLTTGMVGEFPELQGVMGREYARKQGEREELALALFEHYLPRGATDALPTGDAGAIVGIADRIDTITGIFAIDKAPTGANDPFALRRASIAIIRIILAKKYRLKLHSLVDLALERHTAMFEGTGTPVQGVKKVPLPGQTKAPGPAVKTQVLEFFRARLKSMWSEEHAADVVEAVLAAGFDDMSDAYARLKALSEIRQRPDWIPLALAFGRVSNIIEKQAKDLESGDVNPELFQEDPEDKLYTAAVSARRQVQQAVATGDYGAALRQLADLRPAVDLFFDKILVMAIEPGVRRNRLRLVQNVQQLFAPIAEFSRIQVK